MKQIIKSALSLFIIAGVFTAVIGLVRDLTLEPIENQHRNTQERTMKAVMSSASGFREIPVEKTGTITRIFEALDGNQTIGYIIELAPPGYSGDINMVVGISSADETITGMRVLRHTETPGLGSLAVKENFYRKFQDRRLVPIRVVRTAAGNDEIEALTSATITTKAIVNAVNEAITWYMER